MKLKVSLVIIISIIIIGSVFAIYYKKTQNFTANSTSSLASLQKGIYPWNTEADTLQDRLNAIHLPSLNTEGTVLHTHQHLDIYIQDKKAPVPSGIGINEIDGYISPVHTHDDSGVIHIESPTIENYTLGQFFTVWGVRFNDSCIGGYCINKDNKLYVYTNGKQIVSDYQNIALKQHQEIVIIYGTQSQIPNPIPSSYGFAEGL